jgi:hypothetical protein
VKHRREQEKIIVANQGDLRNAIGREQFLKLHRSINSAEAAAENNNSFLARSTSYPSDHRVFSVTTLPMRSYDCADGSSLFVSSNLAGAIPPGAD